MTSVAAPTAVNDAYSLNEDTSLSPTNATYLNASFEPPTNVLTNAFDYCDTIQNNLGANNTYPVDASGNNWKSAAFDKSSSRDALTATPLPWNDPSTGNPTGAPIAPSGSPAAIRIVGPSTLTTPIAGLPGAPNVLEGIGGGPGGQNLVTTYLFRSTFTLTEAQVANTNWTATGIFDDGVIIYLNGVEVGRQNMDPAAWLPVGALSTNTAPNSSLADETSATNIALTTAGVLVAGVNTIAIELHQANSGGQLTSSDVGFGLSIAHGSEIGFTFVRQTDGTVNDSPEDSAGLAVTTGGNPGAALRVRAGTNPPVGPPFSLRSASAGYNRSFTIANAGTLNVSFDYHVALVGAVFGTSKWGEIHARMDGVNLGTLANEGIFRLTGDGTTASPRNSGWLNYTGQVTVATAGSHTLQLSLLSNHTTLNGEYVEALFDNVTITAIGGGNILANDTGGAATAQLVQTTSNGTLTLNANGTFAYAPNPNFNGTDTFTYRAADSGGGLSNVATATLTVNPVNDPPQPVADSYSLNEDASLTRNAAQGVRVNDVDIDGDVLTCILSSNVSNGNLTLNPDGSFTYTPTGNFHGSDTFSYRVSDGNVQSTPVTVSITIQPINDPPVAVADSYQTEKNQPLTILSPGGSALTQTVIASAVRDGSNVVTSSGDIWKYWDQGPLPAPAQSTWKTLGFDDGPATGWKSGASELGYGDAPPEDNFPQVTLIEDDSTSGYLATATNRYITAYFRKVVNLTNVSEITGIGLEVMRDDGVVVNLNGTPVFLNNLASNTPAYAELASPGNVSEKLFLNATNLGVNENQNWLASVPSPTVLVEGANIFAAEVHQSSAASQDLSFDLKFTVTRFTNRGLLANDTDIDGPALTASVVSQPTNGSVTVNSNGTFTYTPDTGFVGTDSFTYRASDGTATSNTATATVIVTAPTGNAAPSALADSYSGTEDTTLTVNTAIGVLTNDTDPDGNPLAANLVTSTTNGALTLNPNGSFSYVPNANFFGTDSFTYQATDSILSSPIVTVTLNIQSVNDLPVAVIDTYQVVKNGTILITDPNGSTINEEIISSATRDGSNAVTAPGSLWRYWDQGPLPPGADSTWRTLGFDDSTLAGWKEGASELGYGDISDSFPEVTVIEDDPVPGYAAVSSNRYLASYFRKTISLVNVSEITAMNMQVMRDDGIVLTINGTPVFRNNLVSDNPTYSTLSLSSSATERVFLDAANLGSAENQNWLATAPQPSVLVEGSNIFAAEVHQQTSSSSDLSFDLRLTITRFTNRGLLQNDSDPDGASLTAILVSPPAHGSLTLNSNGTFTYAPSIGYVGPDSFTYRANDGADNSNVATVNISVTNSQGNSKPTALANSYNGTEDTTLTVNAANGVLTNDTDPDLDALTAVLVTGPTKGTLNLTADGSFAYTPNANTSGADSFTYRARDALNNVSVSAATVTLNIAPVNDIPLAAADSYQANPGQLLTVAAPGLLANDSDLETVNTSLTVSLVSGPSSGTLNLGTDGSFTYQNNTLGVYTFSYRVSDGTDFSAAATVTLVVNGVPVANADSYSGTEDTPVSVAAPGVLGNDTDPENAALTALLVSNAANGNVTLATNGSFLYTPNPNFAGTDSFTYKCNDGQRDSLPATVTITLSPVNDAPAAAADTYATPLDTTLNISAPGVLGNDNDPDAGATLTVSLVSNVTAGTLTLSSNGSFQYIPATGYIGQTSFSYRVSDGISTSNTVTVTLNVSGGFEVIEITEIMFNPTNATKAHEWIEIHNTATYPLALDGWQFTAGVDYAFPAGVTITPGGYLVIPADTVAFAALYPAVSNVTPTGWGAAFSLSNTGESLRLEAPNGSGGFQEIDQVDYSDDGDWGWRIAQTVSGNTGWDWISAADGFGQSLQVLNKAITNNYGQNWTSATPTPGAVNAAVTSADIAPMILNVAHNPPVPTSTQQVFLTCEIKDEAATGHTVQAFYRVMVPINPQPAFTALPLFDDGKHGDKSAGDKVYGAAVPAQAVGSVVEFYMQAGDGTNTRTWPAPALNAAATAFLPQASSANCFYQVDQEVWGRSEPAYRIVMGQVEGAEFVSSGYNRAESGDVDKNVTMIFKSGSDFDIRYLGGLRYRGAGSRGSSYRPHNWRLSLPHEMPWSGWTSMNLNSLSSHGLVLASRLMQCAGLPTEIATPAAVRFNGTNRMTTSSPSPLAAFGLYSHQTPMGREWAEYIFPTNAGGNLYKKGRGSSMGWGTSGATLSIPFYESAAWQKQTNQTENNWNDLHNFLTTMRSATNNSTNPPTINIAQAESVANLDQWARWWAFCVLINHRETNISNGVDDDYSIYFGTTDPRCHLLAHDFDTTFSVIGDTPTSATDTIWQAYDTSFVGEKSFASAGLDIPRALFFNNSFCRRFKANLRDLCNTVFAQANFNAMVDNTLNPRANDDWVDAGTITAVKNFINARRTHVLGQLPLSFTATSSITPSNGIYITANPNVTGLSGVMDGSRTARVLVGGIDANISNHDDVWNAAGIPLTLKPGLNTLRVQALDSAGNEFNGQWFTFFYDDGSIEPVAANIAATTTWTAAGGPYEITGDISVANGVTLTIEPGTTVYLAAGASLSAAAGGRLLAEGTSTAPIWFAQKPGVTTPWDGITINGNPSSPQSRLSWIIINQNNNIAIDVNNADVAIDHITFLNTTKQYLSLDGGSSFVVTDTAFPTATAAFELVHGTGGVRSTGQGVFRRCAFGKPTGYNDTVDFTGGNRPSAIIQFFDCYFNGSDDDILDLDGTDAWIEGCVFLHAHRNGSPDSASGVSGGSDSGNTSQLTVTRCYFYDCDNAVTCKQGNSAVLLHNTIVRTTKVGGMDTGSGVINLADDGYSEGAGAYLEGNLIWDAENLTRNYNPVLSNVVMNNNILPVAWAGSGSGNTVVADPFLNLSAIPVPATATFEQAVSGLQPLPCSPALSAGPMGRDLGATIPSGIGITPLYRNVSGLTAQFASGLGGSFTPTAQSAWSYGYTHYKYSVDGGAESAEFPIANPISLTSLGNASHTLSVVGKTDAGVWQTIPTSYTWTAQANFSPIVLSEILAENLNAYSLGATRPDYVELHNTSGGALNLNGYGLTDDASRPFRYRFPASAAIPAGGRLLVIMDALPAQAGELHAGFGLSSGGETISLYAPTAIIGDVPLDSVTFGFQVVDKSIGRHGLAGNWQLGNPTPNAVNLADCDFGSAAQVRLNEWLASNYITVANDFVELYNPSSKIVALAGMKLTDDATNFAGLLTLPGGTNNVHTIAPLSFMAPNGFVQFIADGDITKGPDHLSFRLSSFHNSLGFADASGVVLDHQVLTVASPDVSQGRSPDGSLANAFFNLPTPGFSNTTPLTVQQETLQSLRITEIMYHPAPGGPEYIEFQNIGATTLTVTGVRFATGITFIFPTMTIPAGGYAVITDSLVKFNDPAWYPAVPATQWTSGKLDNSPGERIRYEVAGYALGILDFDYESDWYPLTDGVGASLNIIDPAGGRELWDTKIGWQPGVPSPGAPPAFGVIAGEDLTVVLPTTAALDGSVFYGPHDPVNVTLLWSKVSGPGIVGFTAPANADTSVSFDLPGSYVIRLTATVNGGGPSTSDDVLIDVVAGYETWIAGFYPGNVDPNVIGRLKDPDHDGINNLIEFALNLDPTKASNSLLPYGEIAGDFLTLTYRRRIAAQGLNYIVEVSEDLTNWSPDNIDNSPVSTETDHEIWMAIDLTPVVDQPHRFMRVRVEEAP